MPDPTRHAICALLAAGALRPAAAQDTAGRPPWKLSGSYLNLFSRSRTVVPPAQDFTLDLNRVRLRLQGEPVKQLSVDVQDNNEVLFGSYLGTAQYALFKDRDRLAFDHDYVASDKVVVRHRLYRATVSWSGPMLDVTIGRQRVPLGTGQFWSALDLLNPIDPTRLERDYRAGVDGVLIERKLGALARLDGVYAPATSRSRPVVAGYAHGNLRGWDYSLLIGTFRGDDAIGADFSGSSGGLGIRGEATITRPASGPTYGRALIGADYGFRNTLTLTVEVYYNGQGASDPARYDFVAVVAGRMLNVARHYGATAVSYQIMPLAKIALYTVLNVDDGSGVLWPHVEYSVAANFDVAAGLQEFLGGPQTEYGRLSNLLHGEARWFF